jgi:hypothetical protein
MPGFLRIETDSNQTAFYPGDTVSGTASWSLEQPGTPEVRLFWYTEGKGTQDIGLVGTTRLEGAAMSGSQSFRFVLPEGPYSFSGTLVSLLWAIELVSSSGDSDRLNITVSPTGSEIVLPPQQ